MFKKLNKIWREVSGGSEADHGVFSLQTDRRALGTVLISYILAPFQRAKSGKPLSDIHTNHFHCTQISKTFLDIGFDVDIINWNNMSFQPQKKYSICVDIHHNLERLAPILGNNCIKILHITGSHWLFQNKMEYQRLLELQARRNVTLRPRRIVPPSLGIENADFATIIGNRETMKTFRYAGKKLFPVPQSTNHLHEFYNEKDYLRVRNNFLWIGSKGMVHKGLDLVLEAFEEMPDFKLFVCGPISNEKDFTEAYKKQLFHLDNIKYIGWVNTGSRDFRRILHNCIGVVYPSCAEGTAGSVVAAMHGGLIPIISPETGVDLEGFGFLLNENTISCIKKNVTYLANLQIEELQLQSKKTYDFVRKTYVVEQFSEKYRLAILDILKESGVVVPSQSKEN